MKTLLMNNSLFFVFILELIILIDLIKSTNILYIVITKTDLNAIFHLGYKSL